MRGADVVVLAGNGDLEAIARSAPAAAVVVTAAKPLAKRCREIYEETLFPRARIIGVADPERVPAAVEAIVFDSGASHEVVALRAGEFAGGRARLGRGGIRELI